MTHSGPQYRLTLNCRDKHINECNEKTNSICTAPQYTTVVHRVRKKGAT